jgi:phosphatidate cytidylyltransferase
VNTSSANAASAVWSPRLDPDVIDIGPAPTPGKAEGTVAAPAHNLMLRVVSAAVMAPAAILIAWLGDWPFAIFWCLAAIAVLWEWIHLVVGPRYPFMLASGAGAIAVGALIGWRHHPITAILFVVLGALAATIFAPRERRSWVAAGIGYAGCMMLAPMLLRADAAYGLSALLLLFAIVWSTDIFAYFAGRAIGGPKLAPAISPKKTWSGAIVGTIGAIIAAVVLAGLLGAFDKGTIAIVALLLSIMAQVGDLFESWVKRRFGAKDASHIIPGHGGVMDRLDGFLAAAVAGCLVGLLRGGFDNAARGLLVW